MSLRWYGYPQCQVGDDLDSAVEALMASVSQPGRVWNPYAKKMAISEFRGRVEKASRGQLRPVEEVKPVDVSNPPPLYEIRWTDLPVTNRDAGGELTFDTVEVRMYHSEPQEVPGHFVAHHAHEKRVDVADANAEQQKEIRTAIGWHNHGADSAWGIAPSNPSI